MNQFNEDDAVRLLFDIKNDGTFYGRKRGEMIQAAGAIGHITYRNNLADPTVYEVHFLETNTMVGCREKELIFANDKWQPASFQRGEKVTAGIDLTHQNSVIVSKGTSGCVTVVRHQKGIGYLYEVKFNGVKEQYCLLNESQLT